MSEVFVYVIAIRDGNEIKGPVKVGISANPSVRLQSFQTASSLELVLFRQFRFPNRKIAQDMERCFHATQREQHKRGEWFDLEPDQAAFIINLHVKWALQLLTDLDADERETAIQMVLSA